MEEIMGCFLVPLTEGVLVSTISKVVLKKYTKNDSNLECQLKIDNIKEKISWLKKMLYGGSFLLAIEHIYHGELSFLPPFLTALKEPSQISIMLKEMAINGVAMAVATTLIWALIVGINSLLSKRKKTVTSKEAI